MNREQPAPVVIVPESTPNPGSWRFSVNRTLVHPPGADFPSASSAEQSPLPQALFRLPGVRGVYVGPNFVTVSAGPEEDWANLKAQVLELLETHLASGRPVLAEEAPAPEAAPGEGESAAAAAIRQVLDLEIRPAVAMDGGDIHFLGLEDGVVKLQLRGSCHGCPSSLITLKMGIEQRLKQQFPEVVSVEAVS